MTINLSPSQNKARQLIDETVAILAKQHSHSLTLPNKEGFLLALITNALRADGYEVTASTTLPQTFSDGAFTKDETTLFITKVA